MLNALVWLKANWALILTVASILAAGLTQAAAAFEQINPAVAHALTMVATVLAAFSGGYKSQAEAADEAGLPAPPKGK